jgi:hypothetical protein
MEQKQYNNLEQEKQSMEGNFEQEIRDLQKQNETASEKLLNEFKVNLHEVQDQYDNSKRQADGLKMIYEERLTQTEDDDTAEITELKKVYAEEIQ